MSEARRRAIFVDRDGTLIDEVGYVNDLERVRWLPRVKEAVRLANESPFLTIMITNQSGVARRMFDRALVESIHARIDAHLAEAGARLDATYYCPHHPEAADPDYRMACDCRKPKPGMVLLAAKEHGIDLARSFFVGDSATDMEAARNAGVPGVLVLTGYGKGEARYRLPFRNLEPAHIAADLYDAVTWILSRDGREEEKAR